MQGMLLRITKAPFLPATALRHFVVADRQIDLKRVSETDRTVPVRQRRGALNVEGRRVSGCEPDGREKTMSCPSLQLMDARLCIRGFCPNDSFSRFQLSRIHYSYRANQRNGKRSLWNVRFAVNPIHKGGLEFRMCAHEPIRIHEHPTYESPSNKQNTKFQAAIRSVYHIFDHTRLCGQNFFFGHHPLVKITRPVEMTVAERSMFRKSASAKISLDAANGRDTVAVINSACRDGQIKISIRESLVLAEGKLPKSCDAGRPRNISQCILAIRHADNKYFPNPIIVGNNPTHHERIAIISNFIALKRILPRRSVNAEKSLYLAGNRHPYSPASIRYFFPQNTLQRSKVRQRRQTSQFNITRMLGNTDSAQMAIRDHQWLGHSTADRPDSRRVAPTAMTKTFTESLSDPNAIIVADASVIIYLNQTGFAKEILRNINCRFIVPEKVSEELKKGLDKGNKDFDYLLKMQEIGLLEIHELGAAGTSTFDKLANNNSEPTLIGGEAAVIALAEELSGTALIDEKKGRRVCQKYYPNLSLGCTTEILLSPVVSNALGPSRQTVQMFFIMQFMLVA